MFLISRETLYFVQLRQAYFLSPYMTSRISSKTVLFLDVPESHRTQEYLRHIFPQARTIWIPEDVDELQDFVDDRDDAAAKLEASESTLINNFVKKQLKAQKKSEKKGEAEDQDRVELDRPTHKTKPIIGKKVDTINWSRSELQRLIPQVAREQEIRRADDAKTQSALFIEFESMRAAQDAFQQASHRNPFQMTPVDAGMTPDDVIWKNLNRPWWLRKIINWASTGAVVALCIWWTIPVAFVGVISVIYPVCPFRKLANFHYTEHRFSYDEVSLARLHQRDTAANSGCNHRFPPDRPSCDTHGTCPDPLQQTGGTI